jgi:organic radical activating enzyme
MKVFYLNPEKEDWYLVTWDISNKCNYRCSYCPDILHNGSSGWPEYESVVSFINTVNNLLPSKKICFRFSGGEPTYWNRFLDLAHHIKSKNNYFTFLTNGSRDTDYFKKINSLSDGVIFSYHPEYSTVEHFIEVINQLSCPVAVNLMLLPDEFNATVDIAKQLFENTNAAIWPKVILDKTDAVTNESYPYTDEQQNLISNWPYFRSVDDSKIHRGKLMLDANIVDANQLILTNRNSYKGWQCWGGLHSLHVNAFGNVYRSDCKQTLLGTIGDFVLPTSPDICQRECCACLSDIYLRKES